MRMGYLAGAVICTVLGVGMGAGEAWARQGDAWSAHARYRFESVSDDAFARDANAYTVRLRVGYAAGLPGGFSAFAEAEAVAELNAGFNSTANRRTRYPVVPDARALELNQAWLGWTGEQAEARLGRQRIVLDNARHVGNVGWRQNEQTFDAVMGQVVPMEGMQVQLGWLNRVHRVSGDGAVDPLARERHLDGRLVRVQQALPVGTLVGYGYWIEDRDVAQASSRTVGLRWDGMRTHGALSFGGSVELARQHGHAAARAGRADYLLVEPRVAWAGKTVRIGHERLGAGAPRSFQTPLATLHAFNGWADKFLVTPVDGLADTYAGVQGPWALGRRKGRWEVTYHDFRADRGGARLGREWDASLGLGLAPGLNGLLKLADYRSDGFAADTRKLWLQLEWSR